MLGPQLLQGIRQPALKLSLLPIVNLHQARLVAAFGLTELLAVDVLLEVQLLLQGLQPVLSIHSSQHLILKLLLGLAQGCLELGHLPPQVMQLALQRALLAESSAQRGLLGVEQSLQVLEPGLGGHQVSLLLGIACLELLELLSHFAQLQLQAGALLGHRVKGLAGIPQLGLVGGLYARHLAADHLLRLSDAKAQTCILRFQRPHTVDVDSQAVIELL